MCDKTVNNRAQNVEMRKECISDVSALDKIKKKRLILFGRVARVNEENSIRRIYYDVEDNGRSSRIHPRMIWHYQVKQILGMGRRDYNI